MQAKLHINVAQGIVDVEGDAEFVREIYSDVKETILKRLSSPRIDQQPDVYLPSQSKDSAVVEEKSKPKRRPAKRRSSSTKTEKDESGIDADNPTLLKDLDVANLQAFHDRYQPKNNAEKILVFAKFLITDLQIEAPNINHFFTCFITVKAKLPDPFSQAFRNASGKSYGYIDYNSPADIKVTMRGENHFTQELSKKVPAE